MINCSLHHEWSVNQVTYGRPPAGRTCSPRAPKVTSRLINGALDPEVYTKTFQAVAMAGPFEEEQVVQHYMDPSVNALKPTSLFLQSTPARATEDLKSLGQELSRNTKAGWKR
eukprot:Skav235629  [mRNA]  locus=scaffold358:344229:349162:- [translate_table: standard]